MQSQMFSLHSVNNFIYIDDCNSINKLKVFEILNSILSSDVKNE